MLVSSGGPVSGADHAYRAAGAEMLLADRARVSVWMYALRTLGGKGGTRLFMRFSGIRDGLCDTFEEVSPRAELGDWRPVHTSRPTRP